MPNKPLIRTAAALVAIALATLAVVVSNRWWVLRQLDVARRIASEGEQLWPDEMLRAIARAEAGSFSEAFVAESLARDADPAMAAEGMLMLARHPSPDARRLIESHLADARVNHLLYSNSDLARLSIRALDVDTRATLTADEARLFQSLDVRAR